MKTKVLLGVAVPCYSPLVVAGNDAAYPTEKIAQFVIEKLDVTSLPSAFRPKKEKGKKTFADYGFTKQSVDENEAVMEETGGVRKLAIKVLDRKSSGLYVCVAEEGQNGAETRTQSGRLFEKEGPECAVEGPRVLSGVLGLLRDWRERFGGGLECR